MRSPPEAKSSSAANSLPRARVSRLLVGSSSSSTRGRSRSRPAIAASVRSPPDRCATDLPSSDGRPRRSSCATVRSAMDQSSASRSKSSSSPLPASIRSNAASRSPTPSSSASVRSRGASASSCGRYATAGGPDGVPSTLIDPRDGARSPAISLSSVDLPAPLRPTSEVRPGPTARSRPVKSVVSSGNAKATSDRTREDMGAPGRWRMGRIYLVVRTVLRSPRLGFSALRPSPGGSPLRGRRALPTCSQELTPAAAGPQGWLGGGGVAAPETAPSSRSGFGPRHASGSAPNPLGDGPAGRSAAGRSRSWSRSRCRSAGRAT